MDSSGSDKARELARALVTLGYGLSYVMEGGFRAWAEAELPVLEEVVEYDASTGGCGEQGSQVQTSVFIATSISSKASAVQHMI